MHDSAKRISDNVKHILADEISNAEDREIVVVGGVDDNGVVSRISVVARGTLDQAPAILSRLSQGDVVIHNHPSGNLAPSRADLVVASRLGEEGIGFFIINNAADQVYCVVEPVEVKNIHPVEIDPLVQILSPGGRMGDMGDYEFRPSQVDMLRIVTSGMNGDSITVAEAGTGVGKSLAYLLPAVRWAGLNGMRIVVSTATINLQQQLMERDIPLVKSLLASKLKAVLVKGRGNYLCLRRLSQVMDESDLFSEGDENLEAIKAWADTTESGSRSDLALYPDEELWTSICSETETCLGIRCSLRERCFFLRARREAASAGILVVNHHLLFSDLSLRASSAGFEGTAVLPPFSKIIFDEAHTIERSATSFFSETFSRYTLDRVLSRLLRSRRGKTFGLLPSLMRITPRRDILETVPEDMKRLSDHMSTLDGLGLDLLKEESSYRFHPARNSDHYNDMFSEMIEVERGMNYLASRLKDGIEDIGDEDPESQILYEVKLIIRRLQNAAAVCAGFRDYQEKTEKIFYIEKTRGKKPGARFTSAPLDISEIMRSSVFEPFSSILFTSATLTIRDDFSYWLKRSGLDGQEFESGRFPSPFPYDTNVLLGIPAEAPEPSKPEYPEFLSRFIGDVLEISEGGGLVLFTSYSMLRDVWDAVRERLEALGIPLLKQGDDDRGRLLNRFRDETRSVLFATDSFWEGVDTPGEALKVLIICRLPFRVPSDPIIAARMEALEAAGGNPFKEISLPDAVMRFKQGFGRLMRKNTDRGVVLITDTRILKKSYGKIFLDSVPHTGRSFKESRHLLEDIESFLYPAG